MISQTLRKTTERLKLAWFRARGQRPFSTGYGAYKEAKLRDALTSGVFHADRLPLGYGIDLDERIIEYPWLLAHLPAGPGLLLDAGSALNFRFLLEHPSIASKTTYICTLAPEQHSYWELGVSYTFQDLRHTCFRDEFFDLVVSLSTLEHIGLDNGRFYTKAKAEALEPDSYIDAVREIARVLRPGGSFYLSVPYGRHIDLGWLQVFDDRMLDRVVETFRATTVVEQVFRYTPEGWRISDRREAADAIYVDLHTKDQWRRGIPVAAAAVACLVLTR